MEGNRHRWGISKVIGDKNCRKRSQGEKREGGRNV